MKPALWITCIWAVIAGLVGVLGDAWLRQAWQAQAATLFQRDHRLGIQWVEQRQWSSPIESSPEWREMEQVLDLDIVPVPTDPVAPDPVTPGLVSRGNKDTSGVPRSAPSASPPPIKAAGEAVDVQWSNAASGRQRLSTQTRTKLNGRTYMLQVTREMRGTPLRGWWWSMWGLLQLLAMACATTGLWSGLKQLAKQRIVLNPWLSALRSEHNREALLPPIEELESELEPALTLIGERVNRIVAELENYRQRSNLVLGNLQEGVLAVDDRSAILLANTALLSLLDIEDESYLNRPLLEVIRTPIVQELVEHVLQQKTPRQEVCEFGSPGKQLRLLARPLPLGGQRMGALLTVRDETMLRRIEAVRRDFVTNASHELKTPLAAIRAYAETLQLGAIEDREAAEGFIANIIAQADRINSLVQGMLQLSRVQSGTGLRITTFEIGEALEPCLAAVTAMARSKRVEMSVELPHEGVVIKSDRDGVQTIISNLLSNAVRYTLEGGSVTLSVRADEHWLTMMVADTGIGIQKADLERIFERFYRAEKDRATVTGGTGLGLSIVKNLVHALDGSVTATSEPNKGSRFEVRLPRSPS